MGSTGFSNGPGPDHRSKDLDERHKRESYVPSCEGRDVSSSVTSDQPVRPSHSQVLSEVENSNWERDRSKGLSSSGNWGSDASQRSSDRDHRERLTGKSDTYCRRDGKFSQLEASRDWTNGDKELEGSRLDRYGSSSRDNFSGENLGGSKDSSILGSDWRRRERSSSVSASRTSAFVTTNGGSRDPTFRLRTLDVPGSLSPPQHSPHSTPSSTVQEPSRDDGSHPSPPKRPRLGWGQGLAKYEKKKVVVDTDDSATLTSGGVVSGRALVSSSSPPSTISDVQPAQELHALEESPVSVVSNPTVLITSLRSGSPPQQPLESKFCFLVFSYPALVMDIEGKIYKCGSEACVLRGHIRLSVDSAILMTVWRFGNMSDVVLMIEQGGQMEYYSL